jgi:hypothetical protein
MRRFPFAVRDNADVTVPAGSAILALVVEMADAGFTVTEQTVEKSGVWKYFIVGDGFRIAMFTQPGHALGIELFIADGQTWWGAWGLDNDLYPVGPPGTKHYKAAQAIEADIVAVVRGVAADAARAGRMNGKTAVIFPTSAEWVTARRGPWRVSSSRCSPQPPPEWTEFTPLRAWRG